MEQEYSSLLSGGSSWGLLSLLFRQCPPGGGCSAYCLFVWAHLSVLWLMRGQRSRGRVDKNHGIIRDGLRQLGYYVIDTSAVGKSFPDLLAVSKSGIAVLLEVKTGRAYPTEGQVLFLFRYPGPVSLVFDIDDALKVMERYD